LFDANRKGEVMALDVEIIPHDALLEVIVTGTYDMQDAINRFLHVLSACRISGLSKVLIDFRDLAGIPATTEKVLYAFGIQDHYYKHISTGGQEIMVAYVGRPPLVSTWELGLQIAKDHDIPLDLFTNVEEAYKWLGVHPTKQPIAADGQLPAAESDVRR
jgi:hypothetical protein